MSLKHTAGNDIFLGGWEVEGRDFAFIRRVGPSDKASVLLSVALFNPLALEMDI